MYENLTMDEMLGIVVYTIQKINAYPKQYGKTVENYFVLLFQDEVKNYIVRRDINRQGKTNWLRKAEVLA